MQRVTVPGQWNFNNPEAVDELMVQIRRMIRQEAPMLQNYLEVTGYHHTREIDLDRGKILKSLPPVILSYGIGGIATLAYTGSAKRAASSVIGYLLNLVAAVVLNAIVNGYFFNKSLSPGYESIINAMPRSVRKSLAELKNLDPGTFAEVMRFIKEIGKFLALLTPAVISALPFYFLDLVDHPQFISLIVLISSTALQYKGVEAMVYKAVPALFSPFQALYRRYNEDAMRAYKIKTTLSKLRSAHQDALESSRREILKLIQTGTNERDLKPIYDLLMKDNPTAQESMKLLTALLALPKAQNFQSSAPGRVVMQVISAILAIVSSLGYWESTKEGVAEYTQLNDAFKDWLLGSAVFLISVALSVDVGWVVGGDLYDLAAYAINGIKHAWRESNGVFDFAKRAWNAKANLASWYNLVQLPLSIQQNLKSMLAVMGTLYVLSYWSVTTSTYLNEQALGKEYSQYIKLPTILAVMLFNAFPVDKVFGSVQRFFTRWIGNEACKRDIKLEQLIEKQIATVGEINEGKFLELLHEIVDTPHLEADEVNHFLKVFFGNKTPADIFTGPYTRRKFNEIVVTLHNGRVEDLEKVGFFSRRQQPAVQQPLLGYTRPAYGTGGRSG